jgi:protein-L-isoaspartate(D-aspartate) O-methyltransferase
MGAESSDVDSARLRHRMVDVQLRSRGIADEEVLAAMERVPRHLFTPPTQRHSAYDDGPLPIGLGQTISQPYMVARMSELLSLTKESRVLEVGTGSGYQAAVLAELAGEVWSIERLPELAQRAEELLRRLGYDNVRVIAGDGTVGFPEAAPYDGIVVTAAAPRVPACLREQLDVGGRMVIPVSAGYSQDLLLIERLPDTEPASGSPDAAPTAIAPDTSSGVLFPSSPTSDRSFRQTSVLRCVFVPLIGADGYQK